jgi:hypothetical protein
LPPPAVLRPQQIGDNPLCKQAPADRRTNAARDKKEKKKKKKKKTTTADAAAAAAEREKENNMKFKADRIKYPLLQLNAGK